MQSDSKNVGEEYPERNCREEFVDNRREAFRQKQNCRPLQAGRPKRNVDLYFLGVVGCAGCAG